MTRRLSSLFRKGEEDGVTTVEYAVMLFLVAIAVLVFGSGIGDSVTGVFQDLVAGLTTPAAPPVP